MRSTREDAADTSGAQVNRTLDMTTMTTTTLGSTLGGGGGGGGPKTKRNKMKLFELYKDCGTVLNLSVALHRSVDPP
jgi:hypothetical protein